MNAGFEKHSNEPTGEHVLVQCETLARYWTRQESCDIELTTMASYIKQLHYRNGKNHIRVFVVDTQGRKMEMVLPP